jgi:transposase
MLTFSGSLRIFLAVEPCDMRKSFNGLYAMTEGTLQSDPKSGAIFVFTNKRRNRIKIL